MVGLKFQKQFYVSIIHNPTAPMAAAGRFNQGEQSLLSRAKVMMEVVQFVSSLGRPLNSPSRI
jgi:hypothetical protein